MNRRLSIYLDLLRFVGAATVFLSHFGASSYGGGFFWRFQPFGHYGVVLFFVLSGFVISYVANEKEFTARDYALSRLARLYSVVAPALFLTYFADSLGMLHDPRLYVPSQENEPLLRLGAAGLFLSECWYWDLSLFSNNAFWSLPYEFWYYVLFGAAHYFSGRARVVLFVVAAAVAGTNILLLMPIWALGVLTYRTSLSVKLDPRRAFFLFGISVVTIGAILTLEDIGGVHYATTRFLPPRFALTDYLFGLMVALNIFAVRHLNVSLQRFERLIKFAAGYTFSLYLYHQPLLQVFATFVPMAWPGYLRGSIIFLATSASVIAVGSVTEQKKHLLKRALAALARVLERHWTKATSSLSQTANE